jgi:CCR4-NOT transcription complex subunit 3
LLLQFCSCTSRSALPQPSDSDWNRPKPRHPIVGPASYPKSQPDVISAPGLFRKMDPEALFFAFYYQPDTYQQYLAAQVRCCLRRVVSLCASAVSCFV